MPSLTRARRGRERCGTHMEPFSFTRRLGTGSRVMRSLVAVARTTEQGRRGEGLSSFDSPRNCGRLVSGLAMKACMVGGGREWDL